jgi:hypothetical protein
MKVSNNFIIQEFVPPQIYSLFGGGEKCLWYIDPRIIQGVQLLRDILDTPIMVNNWHKGGVLDERGYRIPGSKTGATYSQHRFGRACDVSSEKYSPAQIFEAMRAHFQEFKELDVLTIENLNFTPTWVHMDCRPALSIYPKNDFFIVDPV